MEEKTIQKLNMAISAVFIGAAAILFGIALKHRTPAPATENASPAPVGETQEYQDLAGMQRLELVEDFASWTPGAKVEAEKTRSVTIDVKGEVAKAFLTVKASLDGKPLTKYESIFVKLNDEGGHLFRPQSLETPDADVTSLLYELNGVPVLASIPYDESRTPEKADLAATLQGGKSARLTAFVSSLRPALIEKLSISYVCADGSDCALTLR